MTARSDVPQRSAAVQGSAYSARLAEHIRRVVDQAPPLTEEQLARLAVLLAPGLRAARQPNADAEAA